MHDLVPPLDCSINASEILDFHLTHQNRGAAFSFGDAEGNLTDISRLEFMKASHRAAHLLRPRREGQEGQVVAIVAVSDVLVYQTLLVGCIVAGFVPFPISHRNSAAAVVHLLQSTGAHHILTTKASLSSLLDAISNQVSFLPEPYDLSIVEFPLLGQIYPDLGHECAAHAFTPYPSPSSQPGLDDILLYVHSSGNTGFPKSIPASHRTVIHISTQDALVACASLAPRFAAGALPPFHALGLAFSFVFGLMTGGTSCIYPPSSTPTSYHPPPAPSAALAITHARNARANGIMAVPALILEWAADEQVVGYLSGLNLVAFSGGPLTQLVGDELVRQQVNVVPMYGSSEVGVVNLVKRAPSPAGWAWHEFSKRVDVRWADQGDGTFECQFFTNRAVHQPAVENLPDAKGYATSDLFERHPDYPDLYKMQVVVGRLDDVLIMANGEKTVPGPMEDIILTSTHPRIRGAVMFGRQRNQIGVLVEPATLVEDVEEFRNAFWPAVDAANAIAPNFARVYKEMILPTSSDKPMVRAPKGTVSKKATIAMYEEEIEALYKSIDVNHTVDPPPSWSQPDVEVWLESHVANLIGQGQDINIRPTDDLFEQGFNSLNATFLRHRIVGALSRRNFEVPQNFVYAHPSIVELARAVIKLATGRGEGQDGDAHDPVIVIEAMIAKYSSGLDAPLHLPHRLQSDETSVVLLTGSTGGLGSHILELLLRSAGVRRGYAFNRPGQGSAVDRQRYAFADRELDVVLLESDKLVFLEGDTARDDLGLKREVLNDARNSNLTVIIHNAWALNFNKTLSSFEVHVRGTRNLIDLARSCTCDVKPRFLFTSSVNSAGGVDPKRGGSVPEDILMDTSMAVGWGYGESKYVSERILAASGLPSTSFRIGQISGSATSGAWATSDWVPALVKSSIALGSLPSDSNSIIAWIPPETVARTIVDVALMAESPPPVLNVLHPWPVPWDTIMEALGTEARLPLVPMAEWVARLRERAPSATGEDLESIHALKLVGFFTAAVLSGKMNTTFETSKALQMSETMRELANKPLGEEDVRRWVAYWRRKGFISGYGAHRLPTSKL
ncbi:acetyl-CoA synthetase-like protein [Roridomyces roridus]|uniref:Acetyl-CoA synthetase-like protein n=1 Tax=Roridomyces roridus TaxID=1738132 RepID=A0AAD7FL80_9AGAR|nr:acetyl-CoA synthetase-like protein [Roridomyces roridus]